MSSLTRFAIFSAVLISVGCTTEKTPIPDLAGPSDLGLALRVQVSPDSILADGGSQAVINIEATGADGRPVRGLTLRVEQVEGGVFYDFGTLSAKSVVTGDDGRTRVIFTAPRLTSDALVTFVVTPVGTDSRGEIPRTVDLRLVPPGIIQPPNAPPVARFTATPTAPQVFQTVSFDASPSTDGPDRCGPACTYQWDFGDGDTATGIFATHQYRTAGNFQVRLTVTDARGASDTAAQPITVGAGASPTADFVFSPDGPGVGQPIFFNAVTSVAGAGRQIVSYRWNFGDGTTGSGITVTHSYQTAGVYRVTLTVENDAGQQDTDDADVAVGSLPGLAAQLNVSPNPGTTNDTFVFDASASTGSSRIESYRFIFGDGTEETKPLPTANHRYSTPGTFIAEVVVRDISGRTARQTRVVTVNPAP